MINHQACLGAVVAVCLSGQAVSSHEFWLDPETHISQVGQSITADMRVGQDFLGNALPYLTDTVRTMIHWTPDGPMDLDARLGDRPAMQNITLDQPGLHRLSLQTNPAYIVFDDLDEFAEYLAYEDLAEIAQSHLQRGLDPTDIAEEYIRNARALIQVGPALDQQLDFSTDMPFEIVAGGNPFVEGATSLDVLLTWQGIPEAETQIAVFWVPEEGQHGKDTTRTLLKTNADGQATLSDLLPGKYMLNAVRIAPVDGPGSVVWQSHWASLTFEISAP